MNLKLFKNKNFTLLILGQLVSLLGTKLQGVALSLYVLAVTQSTVKFASVLAITMLPNLFLGPFAGVLVDWWDRKKIVVSLDIVSGVITLITAVIYYITGGLTLPYIYFLCIVFAIIGLLFDPASRTIMPSIIKKDELIDAISLSSFTLNTVSLVAPLLAGILYGFYGLGVILIANGISFIASGISEMFIEIPKLNQPIKVRTIAQFKVDFIDGIKYIKVNEALFNLFIVSLFVNFFYSPIISIGIIHISKVVFGITDSNFGLMQSILVSASFITPFIAPKISKRVPFKKLFITNQYMICALFVLMSTVCSSWFYTSIADKKVAFIFYIVILFINSIVVGVGNMALSVTMQSIVPLEYMGRVGTFKNSMVMAVIPLGQILYGFLFGYFPASTCIMISATALLVITTINASKLKGINIEKDIEVASKIS